MMDNRRAFARIGVRIPGKLFWANGASSKVCTIADLSEGGARVDTTVFTSVPDKIDLFEGKDGSIFECVVRWQQGGQIGLQFVDMCSRAKRRALIELHGLSMVRQQTK